MQLAVGGLLLVQAAVLVLVPVSAPRVDGRHKLPQKCDQKIVGCGEFQPPSNEGSKTYSCKYNKRTCGLTCKFSCNRGPDGKRMKISNRRYARSFYTCEKDTWTRRDTPEAYCIANVPVKTVKQNLYHTEELNNLANRLINSSFVHLAMASFFERADVALPGFSKLMTQLWEADMKHARDLMTYVNARGGYINIKPVPHPSSHEDLLVTLGGRSGLSGLTMARGEVKEVNLETLKVHAVATEDPDASDPHMKHYLEDGVLNYHVDTIKKLADLETQLKAFVTDEDYTVGEYSMDLQLRE